MFLQEQFEPYGAVGRVGGDEFAVMIEEEMSQEALEEEMKQFFQNISRNSEGSHSKLQYWSISFYISKNDQGTSDKDR